MYYFFSNIEVSIHQVLPGVVVAAIGWTVLQALFQHAGSSVLSSSKQGSDHEERSDVPSIASCSIRYSAADTSAISAVAASVAIAMSPIPIAIRREILERGIERNEGSSHLYLHRPNSDITSVLMAPSSYQ